MKLIRYILFIAITLVTISSALAYTILDNATNSYSGAYYISSDTYTALRQFSLTKINATNVHVDVSSSSDGYCEFRVNMYYTSGGTYTSSASQCDASDYCNFDFSNPNLNETVDTINIQARYEPDSFATCYMDLAQITYDFSGLVVSDNSTYVMAIQDLTARPIYNYTFGNANVTYLNYYLTSTSGADYCQAYVRYCNVGGDCWNDNSEFVNDFYNTGYHNDYDSRCLTYDCYFENTQDMLNESIYNVSVMALMGNNQAGQCELRDVTLLYNFTPSTPPCTEDWVANYTACSTYHQTLIYYDNNSCGTYDDLPVDNGTVNVCDCFYNVNQTSLTNSSVSFETDSCIDLYHYFSLYSGAEYSSYVDGNTSYPVNVSHFEYYSPDSLTPNTTYYWIASFGCDPSSEVCVEVWNESNTSFTTLPNVCVENWSANYTLCNASDEQTLYYTDLNACGTYNDLPVDNGTVSSCNYCTASTTTTDTGCLDGFRNITYDVTNWGTCCQVTNITVDCPSYTNITNEACSTIGQHSMDDVTGVVVDNIVTIGIAYIEYVPIIVIVTLLVLGGVYVLGKGKGWF
jgi:hypothetical protein